MLLCESERLNRTDHILLPPGTLADNHLNRVTAYRSLANLEAIGLIIVQRQRGRSPMVSIDLSGPLPSTTDTERPAATAHE
jgi:hypothetical protein